MLGDGDGGQVPCVPLSTQDGAADPVERGEDPGAAGTLPGRAAFRERISRTLGRGFTVIDGVIVSVNGITPEDRERIRRYLDQPYHERDIEDLVPDHDDSDAKRP